MAGVVKQNGLAHGRGDETKWLTMLMAGMVKTNWLTLPDGDGKNKMADFAHSGGGKNKIAGHCQRLRW